MAPHYRDVIELRPTTKHLQSRDFAGVPYICAFPGWDISSFLCNNFSSGAWAKGTMKLVVAKPPFPHRPKPTTQPDATATPISDITAVAGRETQRRSSRARRPTASWTTRTPAPAWIGA